MLNIAAETPLRTSDKCQTWLDMFLLLLTVLGPWGSTETGIWPYRWLVVPGIGALWDALWTCKCTLWLYVSNATSLFVHIPNKLNLLSSLFLNSPRSTVATQLRCTTTSCTRLLCSSPMCQMQGGSCWRGSCRRTAPRGWEWRMTLWVHTAEPSLHVTEIRYHRSSFVSNLLI